MYGFEHDLVAGFQFGVIIISRSSSKGFSPLGYKGIQGPVGCFTLGKPRFALSSPTLRCIRLLEQYFLAFTMYFWITCIINKLLLSFSFCRSAHPHPL